MALQSISTTGTNLNTGDRETVGYCIAHIVQYTETNKQEKNTDS